MKTIENSKSQIREKTNNLLIKIGKDEYSIIPRKKNNDFRLKYRLFKQEDLKNILLCISEDNYIVEQFDDSTLKYGTGTIMIYIVNYELQDMNGNTCLINVYIKIKNSDGNVPVISIHESSK